MKAQLTQLKGLMPLNKVLWDSAGDQKEKKVTKEKSEKFEKKRDKEKAENGGNGARVAPKPLKRGATDKNGFPVDY